MKRVILVVAGSVAALLTAGPIVAADGKAVYSKACAGCHAAMAPKLGDKAAFAKLKKDASTAAVIKGKGAMPPKAGAAGLSEDDIKAAIEHMVGAAR